MTESARIQHRQIIWLDDQPEDRRQDPDSMQRFIARLVARVRELGRKIR